MNARVTAALAEMRANRDIHVQWRDWFASCPAAPGLCAECVPLAANVGNAATHQAHIEKYDRWIALVTDLAG